MATPLGPGNAGMNLITQLGIEVVVDTTALENLKDKLKLTTVGMKGFEINGLTDIAAQFGGVAKIAGVMSGVVLGGLSLIGKGFTTMVAEPMIHFFSEEMVKAAESGSELVREQLKAAIPLAASTGTALADAYARVATEVRKASMESILLPHEAAKAANSYTRVAKSTEGMGEFLQRAAVLSEYTGTSVEDLSHEIISMAATFGMELPKAGKNVIDMMTTLSTKTKAMPEDIKMITRWLMPQFATQTGDANKNLADMLAITGAIVEAFSMAPIQVRGGLQQMFTKLLEPSSKLLSIMAAQKIEIYDINKGYGNTYHQIEESGKRLVKLYKEQDRINQSVQVGTMGQDEYLKSQDEINKKIQTEEKSIQALYNTLSRHGLKLKDPITVLEQLDNMLKKMSADSTEWGGILKELAGGSGQSVVTYLVGMSEEAKRLHGALLNSQGATVGVQAELEKGSKHWFDTTKSGWTALRDTLWGVFGEPLAKGFYQGTTEAINGMNTALTSGAGAKGVKALNQQLAYIGETGVKPAITTLGELMSEAFSPDPDMSKINDLQDRLKNLIEGGLINTSLVMQPIVTSLSKAIGMAFEAALAGADVNRLMADLGLIMSRTLASGFTGFLEGIGGPAGEFIRRQFTGVSKDTAKAAQANFAQTVTPYNATAELIWPEIREQFQKMLGGGSFNEQYQKFFDFMKSRNIAPGNQQNTYMPLEDLRRQMSNDQAQWANQHMTAGQLAVQASTAQRMGAFTPPLFPIGGELGQPTPIIPVQAAAQVNPNDAILSRIMAAIEADRASKSDSQFTTSVGNALVAIHAHYADKLEDVKRQVLEAIVNSETQANKVGAPSLNKKY